MAEINVEKILGMIKALRLKSYDIIETLEDVKTLSGELQELSVHLSSSVDILKGIISKFEKISK